MNAFVSRSRCSTFGLLLIFALVWLVGCGPEVVSETPAGGSFTDYRTIAYGGAVAPPAGYDRASLDPPARKAALDAAKETLAGKGWVEAPVEEADVVVFAALGRRKATERYASVTGQNYELRVDKGSIVLDAYDRRTQKPVWKGQVEGTIRPPIDDLVALRNAVSALLEEFPAAGGETAPNP